MADVSLTAYIISSAAGFAAGALPVFAGWLREARKDKRERATGIETQRSLLAQEKRGQCVKLIRLARDFRVLVEDAQDCRDLNELAAYARRIRQFVADIDGQADDVGFIARAAETAASSLASEAATLAATVTDSENREHGELNRKPNYETFDQCLVKFKDAARSVLNDPAAITVDGGASSRSGTAGIGTPGIVPGQV